MKILFVEDNETFASVMTPLISEIYYVVSVKIAASFESAKYEISNGFFDLVILDLNIPLTDDSLDKAVEYGQSVFHFVREKAPGTPIIILTASEPDAFTQRLVRYGESHDIWGGGCSINTIDYLLKEQTIELIETIERFSKEIHLTDALPIDTRGRSISLSNQYSRIIRIFSRKAGGASCEVKSLNGGLSDTRVIRATAKDEQGKTLAVCAGKLGALTDIQNENSAYEQHVKRLKIGVYAPAFGLIEKGVGGAAGLFYTLAEDDISLFDYLSCNTKNAADVISLTRAALDRWSSARTLIEVKGADIRRRLLSDDRLAELSKKYDLSMIEHIELMPLRVSQSCVHGDLHGGNILVSAEGNPTIIDYGDVGLGYTTMDPVTLELSFLFHPDANNYNYPASILPLIEQWPHIEEYTPKHRLKNIIESCRDWAHDVAAGDKDVLMAGYAFTLRQLKYKTVDAEITLKLLRVICEKLNSIK